MLISTVRKLLGRPPCLPDGRRPAARRHRGSYRPILELLECRAVPSTFTVTSLADRGTGSGLRGDLRYAIDTANANPDPSNRIVFRPGLAGTITLAQGSLDITKDLEIDGPGQDLLTVSGNHQSGVFNITADPRVQVVSLSGLTIADGTGVSVNGLNVGGGIYNDHAQLTVSDCTITGNAVNGVGLGGGIDSLGPLILNSSTVSDNISSGSGGGISSGGLLGGTDIGGVVTINSSLIADNQASLGSGGGLYLLGPATITDSTISGNSAAGNSVGANGGGVFVNGPLQIPFTVAVSRSVIVGNNAHSGGGLYNSDEMVTITDTTVSRNATPIFAGGVENALSGALMSITDSVISDNTGIGVESNGQLTVSGSTISGNSNQSSQSEGGGLSIGYGTATIVNSTISGNTSAMEGGGIFASGIVNVELTSVTITGNSANGGAQTQHGGGGLASRPSISQGRVLLRNTLIAGNFTASLGPDVIGRVTSLGFNLIGQDDDSLGWTATDVTGNFFAPLDPLLGPLQDNGGPTPTHALLAGSPAIERGDPTLGGSLDQRGTIRFHTGANPPVDIGAFDAAIRNGFRVVAPTEVVAGEPFALTVVVLDPVGNLASTFTGTIHFSSSDSDAVLPDDYTFVPTDIGVATFMITLQTPGSQQVQVNDVDRPALQAGVTVNVDAPSGTLGRAAHLADLFFGEADPAGLEPPSMFPGRKDHRSMWLA